MAGEIMVRGGRDDGVSGTVIELGPAGGAVPFGGGAVPFGGAAAGTGRRRPWTRRRLRPAALALAAALALTAGGATPAAAAPLTELATITLGPETTYLLTAETLYVSGWPPDARQRTLTARDLRTGRELWARSDPAWLADRAVPPPPAGPYGESHGSLLQDMAGLLLVSTESWESEIERVDTHALDPTTGELRWSVPYRVTSLGDQRTGLATELVWPEHLEPAQRRSQVVAPSDGPIHRVGPIGVRAHVLDLATGATRWSSEPVSDAQAIPGPDPQLILRLTTGGLEIRSAGTGELRQRFPDPRYDSVTVAQDLGLALVNTNDHTIAYEIDSWRRVWAQPHIRDRSHLVDCGELLCARGPDGTTLVDPTTGKVGTGPMANTSAQLVSAGGHLLRLNPSGSPLHTVAPRTGQPMVDLVRWELAELWTREPPLLLTRRTHEPVGTWFGLLTPGTDRVRPLGWVPYPAIRCRTGPDRLIACHTGDGQLRVWRSARS